VELAFVSLEVGEPDQALFETADSYKEVPPSVVFGFPAGTRQARDVDATYKQQE
jgi:hypothetical protein